MRHVSVSHSANLYALLIVLIFLMLSSQKRVPGTNPSASNHGGSPQSKKHKSVRIKLMLDTMEWPPADRLWAVIGDSASENYFKTQPSLDNYALASKRFYA